GLACGSGAAWRLALRSARWWALAPVPHRASTRRRGWLRPTQPTVPRYPTAPPQASRPARPTHRRTARPRPAPARFQTAHPGRYGPPDSARGPRFAPATTRARSPRRRRAARSPARQRVAWSRLPARRGPIRARAGQGAGDRAPPALPRTTPGRPRLLRPTAAGICLAPYALPAGRATPYSRASGAE